MFGGGVSEFMRIPYPTGRKADIDNVVVSSGTRRQGIGRALVEIILDFAHRELAPMDLHLPSCSERVAANEMYRRLGLRRGDECV